MQLDDARCPLPNGTPLYAQRYVITACLGRGGFSMTYRAEDTFLRRAVAIKEFFPAGCAREAASPALRVDWSAGDLAHARDRFLDEGRALARVRHPGVVTIHDIFPEHNTLYMVMEFIDGQTVEAGMRQANRALPVAEALEVIRQAGTALGVVHTSGFLHRDLKPANLMRRPDGQVVLVDFGSAREYSLADAPAHTVILTRGFAPPEQYDPNGLRGPASDIYALAATLYYLVTGRCPTEATARVAGVPLTPAPELAAMPVALATAIETGMQLPADARPQTVEAFLALLPATACGPEALPETQLLHVESADEEEDVAAAPEALSPRFISAPARWRFAFMHLYRVLLGLSGGYALATLVLPALALPLAAWQTAALEVTLVALGYALAQWTALRDTAQVTPWWLVAALGSIIVGGIGAAWLGSIALVPGVSVHGAAVMGVLTFGLLGQSAVLRFLVQESLWWLPLGLLLPTGAYLTAVLLRATPFWRLFACLAVLIVVQTVLLCVYELRQPRVADVEEEDEDEGEGDA